MRESECKVVQLSELDTLAVKQNVTVSVKVVSVTAGETLKTKGGEKKKQDCRVGDASGSCRVVLWATEVGALKENECYKLVGVGVSSFDGRKYLSVGRECKIEKIGEIGNSRKSLCLRRSRSRSSRSSLASGNSRKSLCLRRSRSSRCSLDSGNSSALLRLWRCLRRSRDASMSLPRSYIH